jgi:hypothetical protein
LNRGPQLPAGRSNLGDEILLLANSGEVIGRVTLYSAMQQADREGFELTPVVMPSGLPAYRLARVVRLDVSGWGVE